MCTRRLYVLVVLALLLAAAPIARARGDKKGAPAPSPAALALLDSQGFAVEADRRTTLSTLYRFGAGPHFVTADAGLALYLVLLREVFHHLGSGWDVAARPLLRAWHGALAARKGQPGADDAIFFVALLLRLHGDDAPGTSEAVLKEIDAELARSRTGDTTIPFPRFGTPLDRRPTRRLQADFLEDNTRYQVFGHLLTRVRIPHADARRQLQETMPAALHATLRKYFAWVGVAKLSFPGDDAVFDRTLVGDQRFPPGTLARAPELPGTMIGRHLDNRTARRLWAQAKTPRFEWPGAIEYGEGSLRARLDTVLRLLAEKPATVPKLFRSSAWSAVELQTALAANVLFDRAVGTAGGPWDVFSKGDHPGFVHPHPGFWRALAVLCKNTARELRDLGIKQYKTPSLAVIDCMERVVERRLEDETPFTDEEIRLLIRCGVDGWTIGGFAVFGRKEYLAKTEAKRTSQQEWLREQIGGRRPVFEEARKAAADRGLPGEVVDLERLAPIFTSLAEVAVMQLAGKRAEDLGDRLWDFAHKAHGIMSCYQQRSPFFTCVPRLRDGPTRTLFQGCAGMDTLWLRYPWKGETILCRGAVLSYRERVTDGWFDDRRWHDIVTGDAPPARPPWSEAFVGR